MYKHTTMLPVGFESTIPVFEQAKTFHAVTMIGFNVTNFVILIGNQKFKLSVY